MISKQGSSPVEASKATNWRWSVAEVTMKSKAMALTTWSAANSLIILVTSNS